MRHLNVVQLVKCCSPLLLLGVVSCAIPSHPVTLGVLATPGCTITAENKSFTIASGQQFTPPFFEINFTDFSQACINAGGSSLPTSEDLLREYTCALETGAKRVRVSVPGKNDPLYGVLALFQVYDNGLGPATRSYQIEIPQQYVDNASGGRLSIVYETYGIPDDSYKYYSWILWLSDRPF